MVILSLPIFHDWWPTPLTVDQILSPTLLSSWGGRCTRRWRPDKPWPMEDKHQDKGPSWVAHEQIRGWHVDIRSSTNAGVSHCWDKLGILIQGFGRLFNDLVLSSKPDMLSRILPSKQNTLLRHDWFHNMKQIYIYTYIYIYIIIYIYSNTHIENYSLSRDIVFLFQIKQQSVLQVHPLKQRHHILAVLCPPCWYSRSKGSSHSNGTDWPAWCRDSKGDWRMLRHCPTKRSFEFDLGWLLCIYSIIIYI